MKIGIVGAGAIGLTFAAALAPAHDVVVLARRAEVAELISRDGVELVTGESAASARDTQAGRADVASTAASETGRGDVTSTAASETRRGDVTSTAASENRREPVCATAASETGRVPVCATVASETRRVPVRATADARAFADRDAVLVAVKSYATAQALAPLRGVLSPHALVASVQNGLGNVEAAHEALPGARIVAGSTTAGAIKLGEGRLRPSNAGTTTFGRDDAASPTSEDLVAAFAAAGLDARVTDDVATLLWRKLVVNAAINPLCALANRANGALVEDADLAVLGRGLVAEAAAVARAEGADVSDAWQTVEAAARLTTANRNSMLQDLAAGRPTEIEAISGAIAHRARAHGIAVPLTETMLHLIRARERSAAPPRPDVAAAPRPDSAAAPQTDGAATAPGPEAAER